MLLLKSKKQSNMNFAFLIISLVLISGFVGSVFAQQMTVEKEYSLEEIAEMKSKAVLITTNAGTFMIQLFPEDAPNTVNNFLELIESGYYDGIVFHRIIPNFMIQAGDPNTIGPDSDRSTWGQGGPGALFQWQDRVTHTVPAHSFSSCMARTTDLMENTLSLED